MSGAVYEKKNWKSILEVIAMEKMERMMERKRKEIAEISKGACQIRATICDGNRDQKSPLSSAGCRRPNVPTKIRQECNNEVSSRSALFLVLSFVPFLLHSPSLSFADSTTPISRSFSQCIHATMSYISYDSGYNYRIECNRKCGRKLFYHRSSIPRIYISLHIYIIYIATIEVMQVKLADNDMNEIDSFGITYRIKITMIACYLPSRLGNRTDFSTDLKKWLL